MARPAFAQGAAPHLLVSELHNGLLRALSERLYEHCQGLGYAARRLRNEGYLSDGTAKKLLQLDYCYNLVRHITVVSSELFS